jgi:hypothetical protein
MFPMRTDAARREAARTSWWQRVVGVGGLAVVVWVGIDSPLVDAWFSDDPAGMEHGPNGDSPPAGNQDRRMDPGGGDHEPMDHG